MATVYVCPNSSCSNDNEYSSPGKCPKCGKELAPTLVKALEKDEDDYGPSL